jgi:hypothetical protein
MGDVPPRGEGGEAGKELRPGEKAPSTRESREG